MIKFLFNKYRNQFINLFLSSATDKEAALIWSELSPKLIAYYVKGQSKPPGFSELELRHTDTNGKKYYGFPKNISLPVERMGKLQEFIMWMSSGVSGQELESLLDVADSALTAGIKDAKNAAKIGSILHQIRERKGMIIHTELLYNFLAVQFVREDEDIAAFDNEIQMQKVDQFMKDSKDNPYFFFRQPELIQISHLWKMSEEEWRHYWEESAIQQKHLKESLKIYGKG